MSRVLIVNMPFSNLRWPNLGPSLLKAALARRGIGCDIAYLNFDFAERVGLDDYDWIADYFAFVLGGERLFAKHYFQGRLPDDERYFRDVLRVADPGISSQDRRDFEAVERHVGPFLHSCVAKIDWSQYATVGFAASFQQTMPSMCLARRIKAVRPEIQIVFGGAACEGVMGVELLRQFPEIDYVFLGEADHAFPAVVERIISGKPVELPSGVVRRATEGLTDASDDSTTLGDLRSVESAGSRDPRRSLDSRQARWVDMGKGSPAPLVYDLDELPYPDFDDYFDRWRASPLRSQIEPLLFFETSRGCWWGEKHHCVFCGLNGAGLRFRSKSPQRAVDELRWLVDRYGARRACSADNIFDYRYFGTFLPMLKAAKLDLGFVYEMKTNLTRQEIRELLDTGLGAAQLGIETFLTPVLRLIGKGATALHNLQTLKWFSEAGIEVKWNLLYGFPGEDPAGYTWLAELLPSLVHLAPPLAIGRVRMDRFAPYFEHPEEYGMVNPRANRAFRYVYPFAQDVLDRMAYYYEFDFADGRNPLDYAASAVVAAETWQQLKGTVALNYQDRTDGVLLLHDTRPCATEFQRRLAGLERELYLYCDAGRSLRKILDFAAAHAEGRPIDESRIRRLLQEWIAQRIMVCVDERYLSLALRVPADDGDAQA